MIFLHRRYCIINNSKVNFGSQQTGKGNVSVGIDCRQPLETPFAPTTFEAPGCESALAPQPMADLLQWICQPKLPPSLHRPTGANPKVYYEPGIHLALRPRSTVILFAEGTTLSFDITLLRGGSYRFCPSGKPSTADAGIQSVIKCLRHADEDPPDDSPLFNLVEGIPRMEVDHGKTGLFRGRADQSRVFKHRLAVIRKSRTDAVRTIADSLPNLHNVAEGIMASPHPPRGRPHPCRHPRKANGFQSGFDLRRRRGGCGLGAAMQRGGGAGPRSGPSGRGAPRRQVQGWRHWRSVDGLLRWGGRYPNRDIGRPAPHCW
jgi:hypothetical protein